MKSSTVKRVAIGLVLIVFSVVALFYCYVRGQETYSSAAKLRVESLLRDKSSTLSKAMVKLVGDYDSVKVETAYPGMAWRTAMVDGELKVGGRRLFFRVIDRNGTKKIEYTMEGVETESSLQGDEG